MCDPLTIASIAATVGGYMANSAAAGKVEKARRGVLEGERVRQGNLDREAAALNDASQSRYKDFDGQQAAKTQELSQYFTDAGELPAPALPTGGSNVVTRSAKKSSAKAKEFTDQQAGALGNLRSFGDVLGDISLKQARDASQIGVVGGFKRASSDVVPLELDEANNKGAGLRLLGDVLGGAGQIGTFASLSGAKLPSLFGSKAVAAKTVPVVGATGPHYASLY